MAFEDVVKGLTQNMSFNLFGQSTQKEDNAFTYSPSTSYTYTYTPQTTTTTTTTSTNVYAPKKTSYYAPVLIYSSPGATASPTLRESQQPFNVNPQSNPYIVPSISTATSTSQPQTSSKSDLMNDESIKWILIGGAVILAYLFVSKKL
jgi:hypothetical protein